ncbi:hypothetical protein AAER11_22165, partial [Pseudomonas aeruginosa]
PRHAVPCALRTLDAMASAASVLNVSAYLFTPIDDPVAHRPVLRERATDAGLRGTILLAEEGINLFLAGEPDAVRDFVDGLRGDFPALQ